MKIYSEIAQGTDEWKKLRRGKFTASNFSKLFTKKDSVGYNELIHKVVFERLTGQSPEEFGNKWTERGNTLEEEAIIDYTTRTFNLVERVGFIELDEWVGCSPDGLIGDEGMIQAKCPKYTTLMDYLISDKVPKDYFYQMQGELFVAKRKWNDFFVYHPQFKPMLKRIERDEKVIADIQTELDLAIKEAQKRIRILK